MIGKVVRDFLPKADLLAYLEAILRVYNLEGRRDNKYKARIKILVHETGAGGLHRAASRRNLRTPRRPGRQRRSGRGAPASPPISRRPTSRHFRQHRPAFEEAKRDPDFARFAATNLFPHKVPGYAMRHRLAEADRRAAGRRHGRPDARCSPTSPSASRPRRTPHHPRAERGAAACAAATTCRAVWSALVEAGLATANAGLISDIIACPGMDYCKLATARSIPVAQEIAQPLRRSPSASAIGQLKIKISGCINACGHHHVGAYRHPRARSGGGGELPDHAWRRSGRRALIAANGSAPGIDGDAVPDAIERIVDTYLELRTSADEAFIDTVRRVGLDRSSRH